MVDSAQDITIPTPVPDSATNKLVYPTFEKCYEASTPCAETGQYVQASDILFDGAALPSWITFTAEGADAEYTASTSSLNIDPTFAEIGTYTITVTYTPNNGSPLADLTVINLTVECLVASFTKPANPSNLAYTIYNDQE